MSEEGFLFDTSYYKDAVLFFPNNIINYNMLFLIYTCQGPNKLHPSIAHLQIDETIWYNYSEEKRQSEIAKILDTELKDISESQAPQELHGAKKHATSSPLNHVPSAFVSIQATNPLELLANTALAVNKSLQ